MAMAAIAASELCTSILTPKISSLAHFSPSLTRTRNLLLLGHHNWKQRPAKRLVIRAARIQSKAVPLKSRAPNFELPEPLTGKVWTLEDFEAYPALLVMFICNHCPFVIHLKRDIVKLANDYDRKGLATVAISSNSIVTHPQDGPDFMAEEAKSFDYPFPYLYDEDGRRPFELSYHGQFDDSRPNNNRPITGRDLRIALDCVLSARPISIPQKPSIGCSIKWHPGSMK
ncbi:uncharacterized protein LOC131043947 isoform X2 [Cryptomeria japonica]|uniref:uncharacterized protein LOC131043947 isoform X2 n=1 Tax=Cryptomeria japonica TaxID=3369 RepID=UPI0027DA30A5|nr:uncharacterized protein LOC131043947 isoform X2 [Cryptomeria japonica]